LLLSLAFLFSISTGLELSFKLLVLTLQDTLLFNAAAILFEASKLVYLALLLATPEFFMKPLFFHPAFLCRPAFAITTPLLLGEDTFFPANAFLLSSSFLQSFFVPTTFFFLVNATIFLQTPFFVKFLCMTTHCHFFFSASKLLDPPLLLLKQQTLLFQLVFLFPALQ
jgi:hypothetical protein